MNHRTYIHIPHRIIALLVLFFVCSIPGYAETKPEPLAKQPLVISLDDAVRIGEQHNRELEIARLDRKKAGQKVRES